MKTKTLFRIIACVLFSFVAIRYACIAVSAESRTSALIYAVISALDFAVVMINIIFMALGAAKTGEKENKSWKEED